MSTAREELHRILKAVIDDLERDGYAADAIAGAMIVIGLKALSPARRVVAQQEDEEWLQ